LPSNACLQPKKKGETFKTVCVDSINQDYESNECGMAVVCYWQNIPLNGGHHHWVFFFGAIISQNFNFIKIGASTYTKGFTLKNGNFKINTLSFTLNMEGRKCGGSVVHQGTTRELARRSN
jgi:hypothetical protein